MCSHSEAQMHDSRHKTSVMRIVLRHLDFEFPSISRQSAYNSPIKQQATCDLVDMNINTN